jgi:AcrR family transcriptional regulator
VPASGYARGEATRRRILETALKAFADASFEQVSTRTIARRAKINLGSLTYYFGNKEGLYRACAEYIASASEARPNSAFTEIQAVLNGAPSRGELMRLLRTLIDLNAGDLVGSESPQSWLLFLTREHTNPGFASELLYERVMRRSITTLARLIGRIMDRPADDPETIIRALTIIGQWIVFRRMRWLTLRALGWPDLKGERGALLKTVQWQQTRASLTAPAVRRASRHHSPASH